MDAKEFLSAFISGSKFILSSFWTFLYLKSILARSHKRLISKSKVLIFIRAQKPMEDLNPLFHMLRDLHDRSQVLRGYL
jgi:hypothetical protein